MSKIKLSVSIRNPGFGIFDPDDSLIGYITLWQRTVFAGSSRMFVYEGDTENLTCIRRNSKGDYTIQKYDHINPAHLTSLPEGLLQAVHKEFEKFPEDVKTLIFDLKSKCALKLGNFNRFHVPSTEYYKKFPHYVAFITVGEEFLADSPIERVHILEVRGPATDTADLLPRLFKSSHLISPPKDSDKVKEEGKLFVYMLLKASENDWKFPDIDASSIKSISFPSNPALTAVPSLYKIQELEKLRNEIFPPQLPAPSRKLEHQDLEEFFEQLDEDRFTGVKENIARDYASFGSVQFSEIIEVGLAEAIATIPAKENEIVSVNLDIPDVLKKACIMNGFLFGVLFDNVDWEESTGEDTTFFIPVEDSQFPEIQFS